MKRNNSKLSAEADTARNDTLPIDSQRPAMADPHSASSSRIPGLRDDSKDDVVIEDPNSTDNRKR